MDDHRNVYDADFYAWTREQADVLRSLRGRPELPNNLDLDNVIEEIEDGGNSQLSSVESYLRLILSYLIKTVSVENQEPVRHWRAEIIAFQLDLTERDTPSMRRALDLDLVWTRALKQATAALEARDDAVVPGLPSRCPFGLDQLLSDELSVDALETDLRASLAIPA